MKGLTGLQQLLGERIMKSSSYECGALSGRVPGLSVCPRDGPSISAKQRCEHMNQTVSSRNFHVSVSNGSLAHIKRFLEYMRRLISWQRDRLLPTT